MKTEINQLSKSGKWRYFLYLSHDRWIVSRNRSEETTEATFGEILQEFDNDKEKAEKFLAQELSSN